eukprot:TRINITY_DN1783_c0_g1_i1.p2 TRINITY_DN1783_c0_g1~~TRINITY_DN1783_c0_g1_i1.p2  ORF type:complete len:356 (-),score=71.71 TRINITY_DN1783_c0_g1_i1:2480-3547(-)
MRCILLICYLFLYYVHATTQHELAMTWDVPGFAAFNNQLVIHVQAIQLRSAMHNRLLVSPGFYFLTDDKIVRFDELFNQTLASQHFWTGATELDKADAQRVGSVEELFSSVEPYVLVADQPDPPSLILFWEYVYVRWVLSLHYQPQVLWTALDSLQLRDDIFVTQEAQHIISQYHFPRSVIGVHLRGDEWESNCVNKFSFWDPRVRVYECYQYTAEGVAANIDRLKTDQTTHVFVATNHPHTHEVIVGLRGIYGAKLLLWTDLQSDAAVWEQGLIEAQLLANCQVLIGNYFSTYTQVAALRRHLHDSHFFKNRIAGVEVSLVLAVLLAVIVFGAFYFAYRMCLRLRRRAPLKQAV